MAERSRWLITGAPAKWSSDRDTDTDADTVRVPEGQVEGYLADLENTQPGGPAPLPRAGRTPAGPNGAPGGSFTMVAAALARPERVVAGPVLSEPRPEHRGTPLWVPVMSALAGLFVGTAALLGVIAVLVLK